MGKRKGKVNYNSKVVSDEKVKKVLNRIARYFKADVNVTSGDRNYVPGGGSKNSLHLKKRAADFHVEGIEDGSVYEALKHFGYNNVFLIGNVYEFIWHGPFTKTTGQHLHIGRSYSDPNGQVKFIPEGTTKDNKGIYKSEIIKDLDNRPDMITDIKFDFRFG